MYVGQEMCWAQHGEREVGKWLDSVTSMAVTFNFGTMGPLAFPTTMPSHTTLSDTLQENRDIHNPPAYTGLAVVGGYDTMALSVFAVQCLSVRSYWFRLLMPMMSLFVWHTT